MKNFHTIGIVVNTQKAPAYPVAETLVSWLRAHGKAVIVEQHLADRIDEDIPVGDSIGAISLQADLIVVFGGDGTMLGVATHLEDAHTPVLGVKIGGLGFLTEVMEDELHDTLAELFDGNYRTTERTMAVATVYQNGKELVGRLPALNDVVFSRESPAKIVAIEAFADGKELGRFLCDGLILATPTGSTAHNLSAGGPIIDPKADVFVLTPICPHTLTMRPLVLSPDTDLEMRIASPDAEVHLVCDGADLAVLKQGDSVHISRAPDTLTIIGSADRDYYSILRTKLKWGER